jgi:hypothetical protein
VGPGFESRLGHSPPFHPIPISKIAASSFFERLNNSSKNYCSKISGSRARLSARSFLLIPKL